MHNKCHRRSLKILSLIFFSVFFALLVNGCTNWYFSNIQYKVNFYIDNELVKSEVVKPLESATPPEVPEKEGYIFVGWSDDYTRVKHNMNIYALYEKLDAFTVRFFWGDTLLKEETVYQGFSASPPSTEEFVGYEFVKWDKEFSNVQESMDVNAIYHLIEYQITYLNDGDIVDNPTIYTVEDEFVLINPTKSNHEFIGWFLDGVKVTKIEKGTIGDKIIEARYKSLAIGMEISKLPNKVEYNAFEDFDPTGLEVVLVYPDETKEIVSNYQIDKKVLYANDTFVTISYLDFEVKLSIVVNKLNYDLSHIKFEDAMLVYNGKIQTLEISGELPDGISVIYSPGIKDVGSINIQASFIINDEVNYNIPEPKNAKLTITKAPLKVIVENTSMKVGSILPTFNANFIGFVNDENIDDLSGELIFYTEVTSKTPAGVYEVIASGLESKNYEITYILGELVVEPLEFNIVASPLEVTYNGEKQMFTAKIYADGILYNQIELSYYLGEELFDGAINAGSYIVTVKYDDETFGKGEKVFIFKIKKKVIPHFEIPDKIVVFDGNSHSVEKPDLVDGIVDVEFSLNNQRINVGRTIVLVNFIVDENHEPLEPQEVILEVLPKELEASFVSPIPDVTYTGSEHEPNVILHFKGIELIQGVDFIVSYLDNIEIGTAKVIITAIEGSNYIGSITVTFNIEPLILTKVTADKEGLISEYQELLTGEITQIPTLRLIGEVYGSTITWMSNHTAVYVNNTTGEVIVTQGETPIEVELTAIITLEDSAFNIATFKFILLPTLG